MPRHLDEHAAQIEWEDGHHLAAAFSGEELAVAYVPKSLLNLESSESERACWRSDFSVVVASGGGELVSHGATTLAITRAYLLTPLDRVSP